jgi:hypothetical protein
MQPEQSEQRTTIPSHLNKEDRLLGPFTRQGLLVFILGCGASIEIYLDLRGLAHFGSFGALLQLVCTAVPIVLAMLLTQKAWAGRTLSTWLFLYGLYLFRPKQCVWLSVQVRDRYLPPENGDIEAEPLAVEDEFQEND